MRLTDLVICLLWLVGVASCVKVDFQKIIDKVNSGDSTWVAGHNFDPDTSLESLKRMAGAIIDRNNSRTSNAAVVSYADEDIEIPDEFDGRKHWKHCSSFKSISDQGPCGASWAIAVADTFTDRLCVATNGKQKLPRSPVELLTCCDYCNGASDPCEGGFVYLAWDYVVSNGMATGGQYNSKKGCQPYPYKPCKHTQPGGNMPDCKTEPTPGPTLCQSKCTNKHYKKKYNQDHRQAKSYYYFSSPEEAQKDILKYGSVMATMALYEDFYTYKSGIYTYQSGHWLGGQAVRIIGWGTENGVDYWIAANSWNKNWGENGTFRIQRGTNECQIDSNIIGCAF